MAEAVESEAAESHQPKPKPQSNKFKSFTENELVKKIKDLRNSLTKDLENLAELKILENLHEKGKCVGYMTVKVEVISGRKGTAYGTVFHSGGSWLYTCAHVVKMADEDVKDTFVLDRQNITFEWIDLDSKRRDTHTYSPPQCDHAPPCECGHRIGIFTNITDADDEGKIDKSKTDLALFRDDQISHLQLPTIMLKSIVDMEHQITPKVDMPQVPVSRQSTLKKVYIKEHKTYIYIRPEKKFFEDITSEPVISSNGDTLYHIYWDSDSDTPTKMFYITERIGDKSIGPFFRFDSPAPEGASGSPVMVYRKVCEDREEEFCLVGIMSGGEKKGYIQEAELPELIQQHFKLMMRFNYLQHYMVEYRGLSDHFKKIDYVKLEAAKNQQDIKKMIIKIVQDNDLKVIFRGSLCKRDDFRWIDNIM